MGALGLVRGVLASLELLGQGGVLGGLTGGGLGNLGALGLGRGFGFLGLRRCALGAEPHVGDLEDRQLLAMPLLDAAAGLGPVLERDRLLAAIPTQDASAHGRIRHDGLAY